MHTLLGAKKVEGKSAKKKEKNRHIFNGNTFLLSRGSRSTTTNIFGRQPVSREGMQPHIAPSWLSSTPNTVSPSGRAQRWK